jgi:GNAT superfamily N-acetyltransferase
MEKFKEYIIREYTEDDLKWIVDTHGEMYKREYGFDNTFPSYVSEPLEKFHNSRKANREQIWIAERDEKKVGVIAIAYVDDYTAQLRWFLLLEEERGKGLGNRLMEMALDFSRKAGYGKIILWTVSILDAARHLYGKHGFSIEEKVPHRIWGKDLVEERWDLVMDGAEE